MTGAKALPEIVAQRSHTIGKTETLADFKNLNDS